MKIIDHLLCHDNDTPFTFIDNPNYQKTHKLLAAEYLVMHYTTGTHPQQTTNWFKSERAKVSAHLLISREGEIVQFVPFDTIAWHAGYSQWADRVNLNRYSIGIELDNAGKLSRVDNQWKRLDRVFAEEELMKAHHKKEYSSHGWEIFSQAQLDAALEVVRLLVVTYGLIDVVGHDDVSTEGKTDPGPAFPMENFRAQALGFQPGNRSFFAVTPPTSMPRITLREGPTDRYDATDDLPRGRYVEVLKNRRDWVHVQEVDPNGTLLERWGWMPERYLKRVPPLGS